MNIFKIPEPLLEAINLVATSSWRRDLDIRPLVMLAGLERSNLTEVYTGSVDQFNMGDSDIAHIHSLLEIPKPVSPKVLHSLNHYCGSGSVEINTAMLNHHLHDFPVASHIASHITNIKSVLKPSTPVSHLKLYTGVRMSPATTAGVEWNSTRPIKKLHLPSFTSTSTNFDIAVAFSALDKTSVHHESDHHGVILPNSRHVLELNFFGHVSNAASVLKHSGATHEEEVLLGPNHRFELHPRPTHVSGYDDPVYVWKAFHNSDLHESKFTQRSFTRE